MRVLVRLLEEQAERCLTLAYRCENKRAEQFMRGLAVDLALGAEHYRHSRLASVSDQLADLSRLSRLSKLADEALRSATAKPDESKVLTLESA